MTSKIISIVNTKGGSGKSTTVYNLGTELAKTNRVALLDFDGQASLTQYFTQTPDDINTLFNLIDDGLSSEPFKTDNENLDVYFACKRQNKFETSTDHFLAFKVREAILSIRDNYDIILIDTPGYDGNRVHFSLSTSDFVLIPLELDKMNLGAMVNTKENMDVTKAAINPKLELMGIIPSKVNGITLADGTPKANTELEIFNAIVDILEPGLVWPIIERRASIRKSQHLSCLVEDIKPKDKTAINTIKLLAELVIKKINGGSNV